jgi:tRNA threonylcarbamoyl adenosine modification protein (Sua5/YciO/YrdC/YwlC family)
MSATLLRIHADNPQARLINQAAECIQAGGVIAYPTDSAYALGCQLENKAAQERICQIRQLDKNHHFTLICRDLSEIATYALVTNPVFRFLKAHTPGPYTFILPATHEVPRRLQQSKRKTIGIRVPDNPICSAILTALDAPLMSVTLILPDEDRILADPEEIYQRLHKQVDMVVDGGFCGIEPTTMIDLSLSSEPILLRKGKGLFRE